MNRPLRLDKNVRLLGWTSFFTDVSSEMLYPLIQSFVGALLAARQALIGPVLGLIEGVSESTASLLRVFAGYRSDQSGNRKRLTLCGYGLSAIAKGFLFLAILGWPFVLFSRFLDRIGKGVRSAPRDALIAESAHPSARGRAFGFQRAMDFAGAALGVLLCYTFSLRFLDPVTRTLRDMNAFYLLFLISWIPAWIGVVILLFIHEKQIGPQAPADLIRPTLNPRHYNRNLKIFFLAVLLFTLGNSSNQFLLLRSTSLGHPLPAAILMYMLFNLSPSLLATFFGSWSDRIGRKRLLAAGFGLYAGVYAAFGFVGPDTRDWLWLCWIVYGFHYAMTEGVGKALVSDLAPAASRATALGFYHTIVGTGLLPASLFAGLLYSWKPSAPFILGGIMAASSAVLVMAGIRKEKSWE